MPTVNKLPDWVAKRASHGSFFFSYYYPTAFVPAFLV
jgi:hypothetical protein